MLSKRSPPQAPITKTKKESQSLRKRDRLYMDQTGDRVESANKYAKIA